MRKEFNIENSLEKEVVLTIRVPKDFDENMERRIDMALSDLLYDLGCELVNSSEYRTISVPDIQHVNLDLLKFRDYDDTGMPLQFFFGLEEPKERLRALASSWGYKGELCKAVTICLDLYSLEECPVEAVLTFEDNDERWVDLRSKNNYLDKLISLVENAGTVRSNEALALLSEFKPSLESQIQSAANHVAARSAADKNFVRASEPEHG